MKLKFNPKEWKVLYNYIKDWDEWRKKKSVGSPDYATDSIFLVPLIITLIKSQNKLEKLTGVLIFLTTMLAILTILLLAFQIIQIYK